MALMSVEDIPRYCSNCDGLISGSLKTYGFTNDKVCDCLHSIGGKNV